VLDCCSILLIIDARLQPRYMFFAVFAATVLLVCMLVHHCVMGSYMISSNAAGSPGDRGYSVLSGLVLPTLAMLQGLYNLLIESKAAALQPDQYRWYNILSRFKAYMLPVQPEPHPTRLGYVWLFLGSLVGGYPPAIARGDLDPRWFLINAHVIPQTIFYIFLIDVFASAFHFVKPFLTLVSDGYAFVGAVLLVYSLVKKAFLGWEAYRRPLPY